VTAIRAALIALFVLACAPAPGPTSTISVSPSASPSPDPTPISQETAVSIARAQPSPRLAPDDDVLDVRLGTFAELGSDYVAPGATPPAEPGRCVWFVSLGHVSGPLTGSGMDFVIDCLTGVVLQAYDWIT
jgi:hypothetical protein